MFYVVCVTDFLSNCSIFFLFEHSASRELNSYKSAIRHLTICRQHQGQDVRSVVAIVTTDFEAMYAYKRGEYQPRCLQLSTRNVHTLLYAAYMLTFLTFPEFIQLLDDGIVSLTALTLIINTRRSRNGISQNVSITQLTLSLYLMTQC